MGRMRNIRKSVYLTEEENNIVQEKMAKLKMNNFGDFVRRIIKYGQAVRVDTNGLDNLAYEVNRVGNNLNQIAKVANETGNIYVNDIKKIREDFDKLNFVVNDLYDKLIKIGGRT